MTRFIFNRLWYLIAKEITNTLRKGEGNSWRYSSIRYGVWLAFKFILSHQMLLPKRIRSNLFIKFHIGFTPGTLFNLFIKTITIHRWICESLYCFSYIEAIKLYSTAVAPQATSFSSSVDSSWLSSSSDM